jgi:glycosyltransferase involved in cell wall biosynthesis
VDKYLLLNKENRVLFLRSNPIDPDPRVEKSATSLAKAGYCVTILGWDRYGKSAETTTFGDVKVVRLRIEAEFGSGIRNFPALLRWQWGLMRWLIHHRHEFDSIHACDFDTIIPALIAKLLWKKPVLYDIFDFYADHLRSTPQWIKGIIRNLDKICIRWADGVILVDDARWEQIDGANPKRSAVIYNTPKDDLLDASQNCGSQLRTFSLVYIGLIQVERGILEIFDVLERHPEWFLDIAGFGGDEETIQKRASECENVHWHGRVPYETALQLSAKADVLFATYDPAIPNHRYASPNKVFEAMMLGKPIIVARDTNIDGIIEKFECGLVVEFGDLKELENALLSLEKDSELRVRLGKNARRAYESTYNWTKMESRLLKLYESIQC